MANEDRFFVDEAGQIFFRGAGNDFVPVNEDDIPTLTEHPVESFGRQALETAAALPLGAGELLGIEGAAEQREEFAGRSELREVSAPAAASLGTVAGFAPDVVAGVLTGGTSLGLGLAGRVGVGFAVEAGLGALRDPENPLTGAIIQGSIGAGGPLLAPVVGAAALGVGKLTRSASARLNRMRGRIDATTPVPGEAAPGLDVGPLGGSPGSISGVDAAVAGQASQKGFIARIMGLGGDAPDQVVVAEARRLGFILTPADLKGGAAAKNIESIIQRSPGGLAVWADKILRPNQEVLNNIYRRSIGLEPGKRITPADQGRAVRQVQSGFKKIAGQMKDFDPSKAVPITIMDDLVLPSAIKDVQAVLNGIPTQPIGGKPLFEMLNKIRKASAEKYRIGETTTADALEDIASSIEAAAIRDQPAVVATQLNKLRAQWRNIRLGERGRALTEEGDVSLMAMRSNFNNSKFTKTKYKRGGSFADKPSDDLLSAITTMSQFRERIGNSGTPTGQMSLLDPKFWLGGPVASGYLEAGFGGAAAGAAVNVGTPFVAGAAVLGD